MTLVYFLSLPHNGHTQLSLEVNLVCAFPEPCRTYFPVSYFKLVTLILILTI